MSSEHIWGGDRPHSSQKAPVCLVLESLVLRPIKTAELDRTELIRTGLAVLVLLFRQMKTDENRSFRTGCDQFEPVLVSSHVALIFS